MASINPTYLLNQMSPPPSTMALKSSSSSVVMDSGTLLHQKRLQTWSSNISRRTKCPGEILRTLVPGSQLQQRTRVLVTTSPSLSFSSNLSKKSLVLARDRPQNRVSLTSQEYPAPVTMSSLNQEQETVWSQIKTDQTLQVPMSVLLILKEGKCSALIHLEMLTMVSTFPVNSSTIKLMTRGLAMKVKGLVMKTLMVIIW